MMKAGLIDLLSIEELEELFEEVERLLSKANRMGILDELLEKIGISRHKEPVCDTYRSGKILVIGSSAVKENVLTKIAADMGIDKKRLEFCLDYKDSKTYDYKKLYYNPYYSVVIFGGVPHSSTGKGDSSSVIAEMESKEGYPRVERLCSNNELKITKTNFREKLNQLIETGFLQVSMG